jgi:hypothetical protein
MTTTNTTARIPAIAVDVSIADAPSSLSISHGQLTLKFADGTASAISTIDLSPEILSQALMHGLKQKLVDAAAIARNTETGASATLADKKEAVLSVLNRLMAGSWNATREGGESAAKGSILLLALQRAQPAADPVALAIRVKALTDAERAALMKNPKILPHVQAIQAERAAAATKKSGVDSDALLSDLLG